MSSGIRLQNRGFGSTSLSRAGSKTSKLISSDTPDFESGTKAPPAQDGLAKLVLSLVQILLVVIERQSYRRVQAGDLTEQQVDRLGNALMQIRSKFAGICSQFGFKPEELMLELDRILQLKANNVAGPARSQGNDLENQKGSVIDLIDVLIEKETTISGQVRVSVAGIDLIVLNLLAMLQPVRGATL